MEEHMKKENDQEEVKDIFVKATEITERLKG